MLSVKERRGIRSSLDPFPNYINREEKENRLSLSLPTTDCTFTTTLKGSWINSVRLNIWFGDFMFVINKLRNFESCLKFYLKVDPQKGSKKICRLGTLCGLLQFGFKLLMKIFQ
jgi:hypothetical protein